MTRTSKSFRFPPATIARLGWLKTRYSSETATLILAIDRLYETERSVMNAANEHLWVIEWNPGNTSVIPSSAFTPDLDHLDVLVADQFFALIRGSHAEIETTFSAYPYWRNAGHPKDGRWVGEGGDEIYVSGGSVVTARQLWADLGLEPGQFGADTWDDVDEDIVWDSVPTI